MHWLFPSIYTSDRDIDDGTTEVLPNRIINYDYEN